MMTPTVYTPAEMARTLICLEFWGGKGDNTLKQSEQDQAAFNKQLMGNYATQFAKQSQILDYLKSKAQPMIDNPTGYSRDALTVMRTQASDTNAQQFKNASASLNDQLAARGGAGTLPSGVDAQLRAQLAETGALQESSSQNDITLRNEDLKQQNYWNAINSLSGNAAQYNPLGYSSNATAGAGAVANLGQAYQQSKGPSLLGTLGGIAGGALSGWASGGFSLGGKKGPG